VGRLRRPTDSGFIFGILLSRKSLSDRSIAFPILSTNDIQNFLEFKSTLKENALIRQVRAWASSHHI
jgi:hypothetical protein